MHRSLRIAFGIILLASLVPLADAEIRVDEALTDTAQILSHANNPFFPGAQDIAAINLSFGVSAGGTINAIGFHDLDLAANPQSGEAIAVENGADGITFDFKFVCDSDCPGNRGLNSADIVGADAAVANRVAQGNRYLTVPAGNHSPNIITFHGLTPSFPVYVQLIGGQHDWNDTTTVYVGGDGENQDSGTQVGAWTSNTTNQTAGLFGFDTDADAAGDLSISFNTTRFGGIAAIILQQQTEDSDGDGMPDTWEDTHGLDKNDPGDADEELDQDGLTNLEELRNGTDPNDDDSDDDGLSDGVEVNVLHTDPRSADSDGDGLGDAVETNTGIFVDENDTGTDPNNPNTDGDPIGDAEEVARGSDPNDPADFALPFALPLTDTSQINPAGLEVLAAANMRFVNQPAGLGEAVTGVTFEDVIWGEESALANGVALLGSVAGDVRTGNTEGGISGDSAAILGNVANSINFYNVDTDGTLTFSNLPPQLPVIVQLITGDAASSFNNWGGIFRITTVDTTTDEATEIFEFQAGTEPNNTDAQLAMFEAFVDGSGKLQIGIDQTLAGQHAGVGGVIVYEAPNPSGFIITKFTLDADTGNPTLTWNSRPGRIYAVDLSTDLILWSELDDGVEGEGDETSFTDAATSPQTAARVYYRVRQL